MHEPRDWVVNLRQAGSEHPVFATRNNTVQYALACRGERLSPAVPLQGPGDRDSPAWPGETPVPLTAD